MRGRGATRGVAAAVALVAMVACTPAGPKPEQTADAIYTGGDIVTMNDAAARREALAVKDGKILAVGARADVEKAHKGATTQVVDLAGKTLLPSFIDAHGALHQLAARSPTRQALRTAVRAGQGRRRASSPSSSSSPTERKIPKGEMIMGYGYDDTRHARRPAAQPRRPRRGVPGQPGARRPRVDARGRDEQPRAEEVRHQRRHQDAPGRHHRPQAGHQRALRPDHGDGLPAGVGASTSR